MLEASGTHATVMSYEFFDMEKHKWNRWIERLETLFEIHKVLDLTVKKNYLIHFMGTNAYDVICDLLAPVKPKNKTYEELKSLADSHFCPKPLELVENFKFHLKYQKEDESLESFVVGLKKIAANCNFGNYLETALRNQFVFGLRNKSIQNRCLEKSGLTLAQAIEIAKATELSEAGASFIKQKREDNSMVEVDYVGRIKGGGKSRKGSCYRCGENHFSRECKHVNTICNHCKIKGHLKKCCFKWKNSQQNTNFIEEDENQEVDIIDILNLGEASDSSLKVKLRLDGKWICFVVDTGCEHSLISWMDYRRLFPGKVLDKSQCLGLRAYTGKIFKTLGFIWVNAQFEGTRKELKVFISPIDKYPLLGRTEIKALNLNLNKLMNGSSVEVNLVEEAVATGVVGRLKNKFPLVFSDTPGKVLNFEAKINVDKTKTPIFLKHRPIPFAIREQVAEEIKTLVQNGFLEKVESSSWATPIVVIQKGNGKIRMCGDYRVTVNRVLKVDRHPMPTIEELFSTMSGGEKFSKIDLTSAYLQIPVKEEHREYLTLNTHLGLYRPTRLQFGISSAPAIFQRLGSGSRDCKKCSLSLGY